MLRERRKIARKYLGLLWFRVFYLLKPLIPRRVQIFLRTFVVLRKGPQFSDIWPIDEATRHPPKGWPGWPDQKKFALVLMHDIDVRKGQDKCSQLVEIEERLGFRSCFNFVPERYAISQELLTHLSDRGFEIGVHGLRHDGKLYTSRGAFQARAKRINQYLKKWGAVGFSSPAKHHNLDWIHDLSIQYDTSTFDTDPFEPQPDSVGTVFPFWVEGNSPHAGYAELPYTMPQDFTLFVLMKERDIGVWKDKLDWIVEHGGMALLNTHPDYMNFGGGRLGADEYPVEYYVELLEYIKRKHLGSCWHVLPRRLSEFLASTRQAAPPTERPVLDHVSTHPVPSRATEKRAAPTRVCMLAYSYYEGDNRVQRYARTLARRGDHVDVIALRPKGRPNFVNSGGVHVYQIQRKVGTEGRKLTYLLGRLAFLLGSAVVLLRKHLKTPYDVVHVHSVPDFEVFAAWLPRITGRKVILDIHDVVPEFYASKFGTGAKSLMFKILLFIEKASIRFSHYVIISNHIWQKKLVSRSVKPDKCTVILNYPEPALFGGRSRTRADGKFVFMYPGSLNWHQGIDVAVRAFSLIASRAPQAEFHIYGQGGEVLKIGELVAELGLEDRILMRDILPLSEIAGVMANADVGVVPKRNDPFGGEAFSTKILEFMSVGVPLIISDTRIDKHYFDETLVQYFKAGDHEDLARCMLLLINDRGLRQRLVENSLAYIRENNWEVRKHLYLDLLDSLTSSRLAGAAGT